MLMLSNPGLLALLVVLAMVLDLLLGEARRWHPLAGFGNLAAWLERRLNCGNYRISKGLLAWSLMVLPPVFCAAAFCRLDLTVGARIGIAVHVLLLYFSIGLRSLHDHLLPIADSLDRHDLAQSRMLTARIVSRDTADADAPALAKAAVESLLENGNDAVFGALFWFVVAGGPGALMYRLANTLDAMWGYRTARYLRFGRVSARIDDALNWLPARLTAASYALLGQTGNALHCWRTQAVNWPSPNAGPVMAAGAGALRRQLGGAASYSGVIEMRPPLGNGPAAAASDIRRAWRLVACTSLLWTAVIASAGMFWWLQ